MSWLSWPQAWAEKQVGRGWRPAVSRWFAEKTVLYLGEESRGWFAVRCSGLPLDLQMLLVISSLCALQFTCMKEWELRPVVFQHALN